MTYTGCVANRPSPVLRSMCRRRNRHGSIRSRNTLGDRSDVAENFERFASFRKRSFDDTTDWNPHGSSVLRRNVPKVMSEIKVPVSH